MPLYRGVMGVLPYLKWWSLLHDFKKRPKTFPSLNTHECLCWSVRNNCWITGLYLLILFKDIHQKNLYSWLSGNPLNTISIKYILDHNSNVVKHYTTCWYLYDRYLAQTFWILHGTVSSQKFSKCPHHTLHSRHTITRAVSWTKPM